MWGEGASWSGDLSQSVHEAHTLRLDSRKAHTILGWRPCLNIETAFDWTLDWYRRWHQGADMTEETKKQIFAYEGLGH